MGKVVRCPKVSSGTTVSVSSHTECTCIILKPEQLTSPSIFVTADMQKFAGGHLEMRDFGLFYKL